ncbi:MAG: EF-hand domain-containing protein [Nitrosomonadales bacterium]|nr:EF-hand domain-containing protein [Nitrosomonadales bacterium]
MSAVISGMGMAVAPQAMTGASMYMPPAQKMFDLFSQIDTSGSGSITRAQFDLAFNTLNPPSGFKSMGADAVFAQLDPNNSGLVSKRDFKNGMLQMMAQIRQQRHEPAAQATAPAPAQTIDASLNELNQLVIGSNIDTTA